MIKEIALPFDLALPPSQLLKAGELNCMYENGNLRYISMNNTELVRKIYAAVRNDSWTTLRSRIEDEVVTITDGGFIIKYNAVYSLGKDLYKAGFTIEGTSNNTISFSMHGVALENFKRNRIGLCLHHPIKECRGRNAEITQPDGTKYQSSFPILVSPTLPFLEMRQLKWISETNLEVRLTFEGDVFETEDQRNWSDGSFKTYSTRSSLPRPVELKTGDTINQKVTLKVSTSSAIAPVRPINEPKEVKVAFPQIGYMRSSHPPVINDALIEWLIKIPFDHYRVTITMSQHVWQHQLQEALAEATLFNTKLELVVFFSDDYKNELLHLVTQLREKQLLVRSILPIKRHYTVSTPDLVAYLYPLIKSELPAVKVGYGTDNIFVDVNENRPGKLPFDFISFGIQPQAHAFDNRSIMENLQSHRFIMKTATDFSEDQPVFISPVTLKDRSSGADDRQYSSMVAAWTLLTIQNFSEAFSITFYELFGPAGILSATEPGNHLTSMVSPSHVYQAMAEIFSFQPVWVIKRFLGDELAMDGLLLENEKGERLFFKVPAEYINITSAL